MCMPTQPQSNHLGTSKAQPNMSSSSSSPLTSYRSRYMRSDATIESRSRLLSRSRELSSRSRPLDGDHKWSSSKQSTISSSSVSSRTFSDVQRPAPSRELLSSTSTASARSIATDASADTVLVSNTRSRNAGPSFCNRSTARKSLSTTSTSSPSPLKSLRLLQHKEHIETSNRLDSMRRKLESREKILKSLSDRTRKLHVSSSSIASTSSTSLDKYRHQPNKEEDPGIRLSEFTSVTAALSDDEDDDDNDSIVNGVDTTNSEPSNDEDDVFGTILSKMVHHVQIASSSRRNLAAKKVPSSADALKDDTTEHRSNYSKRRLSITVRRASDFLFSSSHHTRSEDM